MIDEWDEVFEHLKEDLRKSQARMEAVQNDSRKEGPQFKVG